MLIYAKNWIAGKIIMNFQFCQSKCVFVWEREQFMYNSYDEEGQEEQEEGRRQMKTKQIIKYASAWIEIVNKKKAIWKTREKKTFTKIDKFPEQRLDDSIFSFAFYAINIQVKILPKKKRAPLAHAHTFPHFSVECCFCQIVEDMCEQ